MSRVERSANDFAKGRVRSKGKNSNAIIDTRVFGLYVKCGLVSQTQVATVTWLPKLVQLTNLQRINT